MKKVLERAGEGFYVFTKITCFDVWVANKANIHLIGESNQKKATWEMKKDFI